MPSSRKKKSGQSKSINNQTWLVDDQISLFLFSRISKNLQRLRTSHLSPSFFKTKETLGKEDKHLRTPRGRLPKEKVSAASKKVCSFVSPTLAMAAAHPAATHPLPLSLSLSPSSSFCLSLPLSHPSLSLPPSLPLPLPLFFFFFFFSFLATFSDPQARTGVPLFGPAGPMFGPYVWKVFLNGGTLFGPTGPNRLLGKKRRERD